MKNDGSLATGQCSQTGYSPVVSSQWPVVSGYGDAVTHGLAT
jgi:hypothetical protein